MTTHGHRAKEDMLNNTLNNLSMANKMVGVCMALDAHDTHNNTNASLFDVLYMAVAAAVEGPACGSGESSCVDVLLPML